MPPLKLARPVRVTQKANEAQQFTPAPIVAIQDVVRQHYAHQASFQTACDQLPLDRKRDNYSRPDDRSVIAADPQP